ncbi:MAG: UDP-glucose 4-epimerase [Candidatus Lambdaproteobacteria bacterium RIFOXYD2_FULL_50_16]|uniref:UDP-glucose 4-epimerase n=1 Tax=Candidatus Lambdaproteobacteria bacterium RIFOXYD2_FULL_50_16 TaxID=1817772 RepID=A0A1F6GDC9_9PROT|nr:MAG: UDP-glucose 4-epimerase [Candidatus Lambdaproteobacteria bacterium RIFOXYD2_FULL_50_16]
MFKDKTLLITGGTGSFGTAVLESFLSAELGEIRIFSRDEKKQHDLRTRLGQEKVKFYIGDVRDQAAVETAMTGVDFVFHAAALKQVPSCEFHPMEAVKTNVIGTDNVLTAAINKGVHRVIGLSTDKAVAPLNAMGISKAMMEKVIVAKSRFAGKTTLCATRYGNVMASRGSVIPHFINQIKAGEPLTVTDPSMTRFLMPLSAAIELVLFAFEKGNQGDIFVKKAPACTIEALAKALLEVFEAKNPIKIIGTRHGEKRHESLLGREELLRAQDLGDYYRVPADSRDLNYNLYFTDGEPELNEEPDYNSSNTKQLNHEEIKAELLGLDYVRQQLATWRAS